MKNFDEHIIKLIDMLEYDMWAVIKDEHIDCVCRNFETDQGKAGCPYCFGTGRKIKIKKIKGVRQPTSGSARDMTISYNYGVYFFKNIYELKEGDFIIWDNRIEEVSHIKEYCSDAQKPVYYRVEAIPKKADNEIFLRLFSKMIGRKYSRRR